MRIGITDCFKEDKFQKYVEWMRSIAPDAELVTLSHKVGNAPAVSDLDGLLLTGGGDVHPKFYDKERFIAQTKGIDEQRDEFEFDVIDKALEADLPILGVCRGMQVMNVYLGGTLHVDLVTESFENHASTEVGKETRHDVAIVPHSTLHLLVGGASANVTSYHHQAVEKLGNALVATAVSNDGVIEAAEWAVKDDMPFLMLVQWHPERDPGSVVSRNLAALFAREVQHSIRMKSTS